MCVRESLCVILINIRMTGKDSREHRVGELMAPLERIRRFSGAVEEGEEQNKDNRQKLGQTSHGRLLHSREDKDGGQLQYTIFKQRINTMHGVL
jgi:hypothetical protein